MPTWWQICHYLMEATGFWESSTFWAYAVFWACFADFLKCFPIFLSKQLNFNDSTNYKSEIQDICRAMVVKSNSTNEIIKICVLFILILYILFPWFIKVVPWPENVTCPKSGRFPKTGLGFYLNKKHIHAIHFWLKFV